MKKECMDCFWHRGRDYDFGQNFCCPQLEENRRCDSRDYIVRLCKGINEKGDCPYFTGINEYGIPGQIYRVFVRHSFTITVSILLLALFIFGILRMF